MSKKNHRLLSATIALALVFGSYFSAGASTNNAAIEPQSVLSAKNVSIPVQAATISARIAPGSSTTGWGFEKSGTGETISAESDGWVCTAGGYAAATHYARIRYRIPERQGVALTNFYMKTVIVLPSDFYSKIESEFRIFNSDNYGTTVNGVHYGAIDSGELRVGIFIYSSGQMVIAANKQGAPGGGPRIELWKSSSPVPTGEHTFELAGSFDSVAPWYFKIDGVTVGSGVARMSPDSVPLDERVATRMSVGIDGAYAQSTKSISVKVKSFEFSNYPDGAASPAMTATVAPTATATPVPTNAPTLGPTTIPATATPMPALPTATLAVPPTAGSGSAVVNIRIAGGADDVEERADGRMYLDSSDLELVYDTSNQVVGLRFRGVKIPKNATITNAYIQFTVDSASSDATALTIYGQLKPKAPAFTTSSKNVSSRPKTTNSVNWNPAAWSSTGANGADQRTPNIAPIIQEIVNQSNWASGNALVLTITGSGRRVAESYEGKASAASLLHIEYTTP